MDDEEEEESSDEEENEAKPGEVREMLTPSLRKALSKQGYRLLGTHSGVKMCRWTKAMLRGIFCEENRPTHFLRQRRML